MRIFFWRSFTDIGTFIISELLDWDWSVLKGFGHYWWLLKIIFSIKKLLGNKPWRAVDSIKHVWNGSLWSNIVFEKEVIFHLNIWIWFRDLRIRFWGPEMKHLKNFLWQGCFFFYYYLATSTTNRVQICELVIWCISEKTALWLLPKVSSVFKFVIYSW